MIGALAAAHSDLEFEETGSTRSSFESTRLASITAGICGRNFVVWVTLNRKGGEAP